MRSALLSWDKKSKEHISGWYAPATAGRSKIELRLSDSELTRSSQVEINGLAEAVSKSAKGIRFSGESRRVHRSAGTFVDQLPAFQRVRRRLSRDRPSRVRSNHFAGHWIGFITQ